MPRSPLLLVALLALVALPSLASHPPSQSSSKTATVRAPVPAKRPAQFLTESRFGQVALYRGPAGGGGGGRPDAVVLFVSGDGGWNLGVIDMARHLEDWGALVVGVDIRGYLKTSGATPGTCVDLAGDLTRLARFVEAKLGYPEFRPPILVGYSSGATLVYGALAQAEPRIFRGAISLGFCPDLLLGKPPCAGRGLGHEPGPHGHGVNLAPTSSLAEPWLPFQGSVDRVCNPEGTAAFVRKVPRGELVWLDKVGHGFSVERRWLPQFRQAFERLAGREGA